MTTTKIPLYSIDTFRPNSLHSEYQVEKFDKNRNFKVSYPHRHDFYELLFIVNGSGSYTIDFNAYEIKPNKIFFVSPGQVHAIQVSEDIDGFIFLFTAEFYLWNKNEPNALHNLPFYHPSNGVNPPLEILGEENLNFLNNLFSMACSQQKSGLKNLEEMQGAILDLILLFCKQNYEDQDFKEKNVKGRIQMQQFIALIDANYLKNWTVKDYSSIMNLTANHLNETIKKITGKTASDLINEKNILEIKRILVHTDLNVNEIALRFNFIDQSYFSKFFKKHTGSNPLQFRKKFKT